MTPSRLTAALFLSIAVVPQVSWASQATVDGLVAEIKAIAAGTGASCDKVAAQHHLAQAIRVIRTRHIEVQTPDSIAAIDSVHAKCFGPNPPISPGRVTWGGGVFDSRVPEIAAALAFMPGANRDKFEEILPDETLSHLEAWRQANPKAAADLQSVATGELREIALDTQSELIRALQENDTPVDASLREALEKQVEDFVGASPPD